MRRNQLILLLCLLVGVLVLFNQSRAVCPQDTLDSGECDTMYVEVWPGDELTYSPYPVLARFPIYVTHDVPDPTTDSLAAFVIPLCYTHTNSTKYCSLSSYWNPTSFTNPRSIFRHLYGVHNWMMDQFQEGKNEEWDQIILNLDGTSHFWLGLIATGSKDQHFGEGSRILLATMTFKLEDTMNICIDTCLWPPANRLTFTSTDMRTYIPRHFLPKCQEFIECSNLPPYFSTCPGGVAHHTNGHYITSEFVANTPDFCSKISSVWAIFQGAGVENVSVVYDNPPPAFAVQGHVEYDVTDHCQPGGNMALILEDDTGGKDTCYFSVTLDNNMPPSLAIPDTVLALADHTTVIQVSATDPENDLVETGMDAFWFKSDSLQAPTNPPSYQGGNPGFFTWVPTEADTGTWIALFTAVDTCRKADTAQAIILVGITFCGDCIRDTIINVGDVIYLIGYLYKGGHPPDPVCRGDANCNDAVEIGDVMLLINYLFKGGSVPCFGCCDKRSSGALIKPE